MIRSAEGGTVNGTLAALNRVLDLTVAEWRAQGGTMVIPNRGRIYDEGDVAEYRDMMMIVRDRVQDAIGKGLTLEQTKRRGSRATTTAATGRTPVLRPPTNSSLRCIEA